MGKAQNNVSKIPFNDPRYHSNLSERINPFPTSQLPYLQTTALVDGPGGCFVSDGFGDKDVGVIVLEHIAVSYTHLTLPTKA